jgi:hypothetical protein
MDYIKSPITNRMVKIGSRAYKHLVAEKMIQHEADCETLYESENKDELKVAKKMLTKQGIGRRKVPQIRGNKVVACRASITPTDMTKHTARSATKVFNKIKSGDLELPDDMDDAQLTQFLEQCILSETIGGDMTVTKKKKPVKLPPKKNIGRYRRSRIPIESEVESTCAENESDDSHYSDESESEIE